MPCRPTTSQKSAMVRHKMRSKAGALPEHEAGLITPASHTHRLRRPEDTDGKARGKWLPFCSPVRDSAGTEPW